MDERIRLNGVGSDHLGHQPGPDARRLRFDFKDDKYILVFKRHPAAPEPHRRVQLRVSANSFGRIFPAC